MESNIDSFEKYKMVHHFMYPNDPLKKWINETNFINTYENDWNVLMPVVEKIENLDFFCMINKWTSIYKGSLGSNRTAIATTEGNSKIMNTYIAVTKFIKWYNEKQSNNT